MKLSRELANQLRISTRGMERFELIRKIYANCGLYDEFRSTKFWKDKGQLEWLWGRELLTDPAYFIQRADSQFKVVVGISDRYIALHCLKEYLDEDVDAKVIECKVPELLARRCRESEMGVYDFVALRHPSWEVRKAVAMKILEWDDAQDN